MSILLCLILSVPDGDSMRAKCESRVKPVSLRLIEIDAPEVKHSGFVKMDTQPFGPEAQKNLAGYCYKQRATVHALGKDRYGRTLARVECQGVDVNAAQAEAGLAWPYEPKRGSRIPGLVAKAQAAHAGLWSDPSPIPPSQWRKGQR